jgi:hypothetical protein
MPVPAMNTRRWMIAIALAGVVLACVGIDAYLKRPFPTHSLSYATPYAPGSEAGEEKGPARRVDRYQAWSDGWIIRVDEAHPEVKGRTRFGPLSRVEWPDGSTSWYWLRPYPVHETEKLWDGTQTWHLERGEGPLGTGGPRTGPFADERPPR